MFSKGSKIYSIMSGACPKCHQDNMYVNPNPYALSQTMKMHDKCRKCGFTYKMEPNFFFGAMYVSYGLAVMAGIFAFIISKFVFNAGLLTAFISIFVSLIVLMPVIARLARNIYINMFVSYNPEAGKKGL